MSESKYRDYEVDVSIADMLFFLLRHYRSGILALILGGLLGAALYGYTSIQAQREAKEAAEAVLTLENFDASVYEIDEDVQANMELAYQYRLKYHNLMDYMESSLVMQLDPDEIYQGKLEYYIYDTDEAVLIASLYQSILNEDGIWEELAEASGLDIDAKDLYECITSEMVSDGLSYDEIESKYLGPSYALITFQVVSIDEESCQAMTELLAEKIAAKKQELGNTYGSYSIAEISCSVVETSDDSYVTLQNTYITQLNTYRTNYTSLESNFSDEELEYYTYVYLSILEESGEDVQSEDTEGIAADTDTLGSAEAADTEAAVYASTEDAADTIDTEDTSWSMDPVSFVKWLVIGLVLGFLVWAAVWVIYYLLNGRVKTNLDLTGAFGLAVIGSLRPLETGGETVDKTETAGKAAAGTGIQAPTGEEPAEKAAAGTDMKAKTGGETAGKAAAGTGIQAQTGAETVEKAAAGTSMKGKAGWVTAGKTGRKKGIDAWIESLYEKFKGQPDTQAYVEGAIESLPQKQLVLCGDVTDPVVKLLMENLTATADSRTCCDWCSKSPESLGLTQKADAEILVIHMHKTLRRDIEKELMCCELQGIQVAGCICVEG